MSAHHTISGASRVNFPTKIRPQTGLACSFAITLSTLLSVGCGSGPTVGTLELAAEAQFNAVESNSTRAVNWSTGEADAGVFDGKSWTQTMCVVDETTIKYEILKPQKSTSPKHGVVTFMLEMQHSAYVASEMDASDAPFTITRTVDCRFVYRYVDNQWELQDTYWHVMSGRPRKIFVPIIEFFGVK